MSGSGFLSNKKLQYNSLTNIGKQKSNKEYLTNKMDFSKAKRDGLRQHTSSRIQTGLTALKLPYNAARCVLWRSGYFRVASLARQ